MNGDTLSNRFLAYTFDLATAVPRTYSGIFRGVRSDGDGVASSTMKSIFLGSVIVGTGIMGAGTAAIWCGMAGIHPAATAAISSFTLSRTVAFLFGNSSPDPDRDLPRTRALQRSSGRHFDPD